MQNEHTQHYVLLKNGHVAPVEFYDSIKYQVQEAADYLPRYITAILEHLCGDIFWSELTTEERKLAGRCMAHLVEHRLVPFEYVGCRHAYPKRYRLI